MPGEVMGVHIARAPLNNSEFDLFGAGIMLRLGSLSAYALATPESRFDMPRPL